MKTNSLKLGLCAALLSMLMVGCSTTDTTDTSDAETGSQTLPDDPVTTGTVDDSGVMGTNNDLLTYADTVFYFDFDKSILRAESREALRTHAAHMKRTGRSVRLEGHGDERGTREYNMALGERRGIAVKEFLVMEGVNASQIEVISYGEESPAALGSDEASYALNRRVEMK